MFHRYVLLFGLISTVLTPSTFNGQPPLRLQPVGELVVVDSQNTILGTVRQWSGMPESGNNNEEPIVTFQVGDRFFQARVHQTALYFGTSVFFESADCTGIPFLAPLDPYSAGTFRADQRVAVAGKQQIVYLGDRVTLRPRAIRSELTDGDDTCFSNEFSASMADATSTDIAIAQLYIPPFKLAATRPKITP